MHDRTLPLPSRRSLLIGGGALAASAAVVAPARAEQPAPEPTLAGPAALTAAVRGSAVLDGQVHIASRHNPVPGVIRLGTFDPFTGEQVAVHDLEIASTAGNNAMTADDRYVYLGPAAHTHVWRVDPTTGQAEPFAEVGGAGTWTYGMRVHGEHLWIGTYPTCRLLRVTLATGEVLDCGRVGTSQYATAVAADDETVVAGTAAPGMLKTYSPAGEELADLTEHLLDSPVGILDVALSEGTIYVSCGRFILSMRPDGSERVVRDIPAEDRYVDKLTVTPDGSVLALARLTSNYYEVTAEGLEPLGAPWQDVENQGFFAVDDDMVVGVTGVGHVWSAPIGGEALVTSTATTDFGYPEVIQSMLLHSSGDVWVGGHFAMTVHHPRTPRFPGDRGLGTGREPDRFEADGEPKSMAELADGTVIAGYYPSTRVVAYHPVTHEPRLLGVIDDEQMRPLSMVADDRRGQVIVATTAKQGLFTGALTFADPSTGEFEVRRDLVPDQNLRNIVVVGDLAYTAGDTWAEASSERKLPTATLTEIDLRTRTVTRVLTPREWESYENIVVVDGVLFAVARRPNGAWFALDLATEQILGEGDTGGYGGLGVLRGAVYSWDLWTDSIQQLSPGGGNETILEVPNGWYNRPDLEIDQRAHGMWGMHGTDLAWFPLPR